jgi:opacity protein-like surface antigen
MALAWSSAADGTGRMYRILALVGAVFFGTIGVACAETAAPLSGTTAISLAPAWLLPHSGNDGQLSKESARSGDRLSTGGFRTEVEAINESVAIPGQGMTPVGSLSATRVMVSGLYELDGGAWRLKPFVGAGFGVMDVSTILLGHEQQSLATDVQFKGGVNFNITQKLLGSFEWRWSHGSKPTFALGGVPTKFQLKRGGFLIGVNYKLQ